MYRIFSWLEALDSVAASWKWGGSPWETGGGAWSDWATSQVCILRNQSAKWDRIQRWSVVEAALTRALKGVPYSKLQAKWWAERWSISLTAVWNQALLVWGACHQIDSKLQAVWWAERLSHWLDSMTSKSPYWPASWVFSKTRKADSMQQSGGAIWVSLRQAGVALRDLWLSLQSKSLCWGWCRFDP